MIKRALSCARRNANAKLASPRVILHCKLREINFEAVNNGANSSLLLASISATVNIERASPRRQTTSIGRVSSSFSSRLFDPFVDSESPREEARANTSFSHAMEKFFSSVFRGMRICCIPAILYAVTVTIGCKFSPPQRSSSLPFPRYLLRNNKVLVSPWLKYQRNLPRSHPPYPRTTENHRGSSTWFSGRMHPRAYERVIRVVRARYAPYAQRTWPH